MVAYLSDFSAPSALCSCINPKEETEEEGEKESVHPFIERYGWMFSAKQLAEYEGITLEEVYNIPIIQAFNGLSYLKSKAGYEKMKSKL